MKHEIIIKNEIIVFYIKRCHKCGEPCGVQMRNGKKSMCLDCIKGNDSKMFMHKLHPFFGKSNEEVLTAWRSGVYERTCSNPRGKNNDRFRKDFYLVV